MRNYKELRQRLPANRQATGAARTKVMAVEIDVREFVEYILVDTFGQETTPEQIDKVAAKIMGALFLGDVTSGDIEWARSAATAKAVRLL